MKPQRDPKPEPMPMLEVPHDPNWNMKKITTRILFIVLLLTFILWSVLVPSAKAQSERIGCESYNGEACSMTSTPAAEEPEDDGKEVAYVGILIIVCSVLAMLAMGPGKRKR